MPNLTDHSNRLLPRICHELEKLPLTCTQKAEITPKLLEYVRFMDTDGGRKKGSNCREDSATFDFEQKISAVVDKFAAEDLTVNDYLHAALKQPSLFLQSPETIPANITG